MSVYISVMHAYISLRVLREIL